MGKQTYKSMSHKLAYPTLELFNLNLVIRKNLGLEPYSITIHNTDIIGEDP